MIRYIAAIISAILLPSFGWGAVTYYDFNEANSSGTTWQGWTYSCTDISYSACGFRLTNGTFINNYWVPRLYEKRDYGNYTDITINTSDRSPSTATGNSLLIADNGNGTTYQPSAWFDNANNFGALNYATASTDRLSMYIKIEGRNRYTTGAGAAMNLELGTYTCWEDGGYGGEDCPYAESSNGHWYHQTQINTGAWVHVLWNQHPTHRRDVSVTYPPDDPSYVESSRHYFENMFRFYLQMGQAVATPDTAKIYVDEIRTLASSETGESAQNNISIGNIWVGYWSSDGTWEIGWTDATVKGDVQREYEIRWSTSPITNANWSSATIVTPLVNVVNTNHVNKYNSWYPYLWTRFTLPAWTETNNDKVYFAVKDVGTSGSPAANYYAASSGNIHSTWYDIRPSSGSPDPTCSDGIQNGEETGVDCGGSCSACSAVSMPIGAGAMPIGAGSMPISVQ